jgi:TonB family protein
VRCAPEQVLPALPAALGLLLVLLPAAGCGRRPARSPERAGYVVALPVHVMADTGRGQRLPVHVPVAARLWLASVTPSRAALPSPVPPAPLPDSSPPLEDSPPALAVDPGLKPPVLREPALLALAPGARGARGRVELDVRVDETGRVSDALWAAGSADSSLIDAARRCALGMRFYPALRAGRPVAVWCRQRFEVRSMAP